MTTNFLQNMPTIVLVQRKLTTYLRITSHLNFGMSGIMTGKKVLVLTNQELWSIVDQSLSHIFVDLSPIRRPLLAWGIKAAGLTTGRFSTIIGYAFGYQASAVMLL